MTAVGHIREPVRHMLRCWACGVGRRYDAHGGHYAGHADRVSMYERCVEAAERLRVFSIAEVVQAVGRSPTSFSMAALAVHDMALHGLARCVQSGRTPNHNGVKACYRWELVT